MELSNLSSSPEFGKYFVSTFDLYCQEWVLQSCNAGKVFFKHLKCSMGTRTLGVHDYKGEVQGYLL